MSQSAAPKVLWQNEQWAVMHDGVQSTASGDEYFIPISRLGERLWADKKIGLWPVQIAQKTWADLDLFWDAYLKALDIHLIDERETIDLEATRRRAEKAKPTGETSHYNADI